MDEYLQELKRLHDFYKTGPFSKAGIAICLGVNRRTVMRWFKGTHPPKKEHRVLIEQFVSEFKLKQTNYNTRVKLDQNLPKMKCKMLYNRNMAKGGLG